MNKILVAAAILALAACESTQFPSGPAPRARGYQLIATKCANSKFDLAVNYIKWDSQADFLAGSQVVSTVRNAEEIKHSGCVYVKGDVASVRLTPFGDVTRYLDPQTTNTTVIQ